MPHATSDFTPHLVQNISEALQVSVISRLKDALEARRVVGSIQNQHEGRGQAWNCPDLQRPGILRQVHQVSLFQVQPHPLSPFKVLKFLEQPPICHLEETISDEEEQEVDVPAQLAYLVLAARCKM